MVGFAYLATSAFAVLVGDRIAQESHDIASILFGTAVLVRPEDLLLVGGVGAVVLVCLAIAGRGLIFSGFDAEGARVHGLPVRALELGLWTLVAAEVAVSARALGALPVFAFAVLPATAALAVATRMRGAVLTAGLLGALSAALGYLGAFFYELPVGASQAAVAVVLALGALAWRRLRR